jgi:hypothetical protein
MAGEKALSIQSLEISHGHPSLPANGSIAVARHEIAKRNFDAVLFDSISVDDPTRKLRTFCWTQACHSHS